MSNLPPANEARLCSKAKSKRCFNPLPQDWSYKLCPTCRKHDQDYKERSKNKRKAETSGEMSQRTAPHRAQQPQAETARVSSPEPETQVRFILLNISMLNSTPSGVHTIQRPTSSPFISSKSLWLKFIHHAVPWSIPYGP
jgi:hypothetical protein